MKKFSRTIEDFICKKCGNKCVGNGYTNHCPHCLYSCHVDNNPCDRAATCHGMMQPISAAPSANGFIITHKCEKCGKTIRQKSSENDDTDALIKLTTNSTFIFGK
ncbi:RNHCP domain-containing protein [bacterium]|nr:RNHCP domain-containing protein [bacterium]